MDNVIEQSGSGAGVGVIPKKYWNLVPLGYSTNEGAFFKNHRFCNIT